MLHATEGPPTITVANKTGSIRGVRNDVGLVYTPNFTHAIALMSIEGKDLRVTPDNEARVALGEASKLVYEHFIHSF